MTAGGERLAVEAHSVGKRFRGKAGGSTVPIPSLRPRAREERWALRGVSFSVPAGTGFGIVGRNGSGKSTLLRVLARVTPPTEGRVLLRGRVAPMPALASAFIQGADTGRANILTLADVFGVPRAEAQAAVPAIAEFTELDAMIDEKVQSYSTGQFARLAFGTALGFQPDIMLADERLAVGDSQFRNKCLTEIEERVARGMTLILATHDLRLLERFCAGGIVLSEGEVVAAGSTADVVAAFEGLSAAERDLAEDADDRDGRVGRVLSAAVFAMNGSEADLFRASDDVLVEATLDIALPGIEVGCVLSVISDGEEVLRARQPERFTVRQAGRHVLSVHVPGGTLGDGPHEAKLAVWAFTEDERLPIGRWGPLRFDVQAEDGEGDEELPEPPDATAEPAWALSAADTP